MIDQLLRLLRREPTTEAVMGPEPRETLRRMRTESLRVAKRLGFPAPTHLPLLDEVERLRADAVVVDRTLALSLTLAVAYGFDRKLAVAWVRQERLEGALTRAEAAFIKRGAGERESLQLQVEALWALAWSLGIGPGMDFRQDCPDQLVTYFPDVKRAESADGFRSRARLRPAEEVAGACDLAYCLHWGIRDAQLRRKRVPGKVAPYVVIERRRALEWLTGSEEWDEISLDT